MTNYISNKITTAMFYVTCKETLAQFCDRIWTEVYVSHCVPGHKS